MDIRTSSDISVENLSRITELLRKAAKETNNPNYFGQDETINIVKSPEFPSIEKLLPQDGKDAKIAGDPTLCSLGYQAALRLCGSDTVCQAAAFAAYQYCLTH
jgi:hypothetical protein